MPQKTSAIIPLLTIPSCTRAESAGQPSSDPVDLHQSVSGAQPLGYDSMMKPTVESPPAAQAPQPPLVLDVRPIFAGGQTPCGAIDDAVRQLAPGQDLVLLVPFEPIPLYTKLRNYGFTHQSSQMPDGTWQVDFHRPEGSASLPAGSIACGCDDS